MEEQQTALQKGTQSMAAPSDASNGLIAEPEVDRVAQRQKLAYERTSEAIEQIRERLLKAKEELSAEKMAIDAAASPPPAEKPLEKMMKTVQELQIAQKLSNEQKEMYSVLAKWGKLIDKQFNADVIQLLGVQPDFDRNLLLSAIMQHLFKKGHVAAGLQLGKEAGLAVTPDMYEPYVEVHEVVRQIKAGNLQPALRWAADHRAALEATEFQSLEFQLHRAVYVTLLSQRKRVEALAYARGHFPPFARRHLKEIQKLMCALAFVHRLERSPYKDLLSPSLIPELLHFFNRAASAAVGSSPDSALSVAVDAGLASIPVHLKLASLMKSKAQEVGAKALPVEIDLGSDFLFHSIFTCPVSREQSTAENPPVLLHCGHVIAKSSMLKLARGAAQRFKCPYCPIEQSVSQSRPITF